MWVAIKSLVLGRKKKKNEEDAQGARSQDIANNWLCQPVVLCKG